MATGKSRLQYTAEGSVTLDGAPFGGPVDVCEDPDPPFDWLAALELPKDWALLDRLSEYQSFSDRFVRFVLADESPTRFPGAPRLRPRAYRYHPHGMVHLTLEHIGYNIGAVWSIEPGLPDEVPNADGYFLVGSARLYDSALADAAWRGIHSGIFGHVCAVLGRAPQDLFGSGAVLEVAVINRPGCPGARILKTWGNC